jgi:hypothetical protein
MDGYQFIAALFQSLISLAWPAAIVVVVWLFRGKLVDLLPLARVKYKDLEFRFQEAEKEAAKLPPIPDSPDTEPTPEEKSRFEQLAKLSPRGAILEVRADLEEAVRTFARTIGLIDDKVYRPYAALLRLMQRHELVDQNTSALLHDLRAIGNAAAHNQSDPTEDEALRFYALAEKLIRQLNTGGGAAKMPPPGPIWPGP